MILKFCPIVYNLDISSRLDRWIRRQYPGVTQGVIEKAVRKKLITINAQKCLAKTNLMLGDQISIESCLLDDFKNLKHKTQKNIHIKPQSDLDFQHLILDETPDFLILNKPAGLDVQGGKNVSISVDHWLKSRSDPYRLVHRIDRATSGLLLIAKTLSASVFLTKLFREKKIKKVYRAIVLGKLAEASGVIDIPLKADGAKMICVPNGSGQAARTNYKVIRYCAEENWSEVELYPETGRKHQIRAHLAYIGAPIVGDKKYDMEQKTFYLFKQPVKNTLFLHAYKMAFCDEKGKKYTWSAPLPSYWPVLS